MLRIKKKQYGKNIRSKNDKIKPGTGNQANRRILTRIAILVKILSETRHFLWLAVTSFNLKSVGHNSYQCTGFEHEYLLWYVNVFIV